MALVSPEPTASPGEARRSWTLWIDSTLPACGDLGAELIVEATGLYLTKKTCRSHIDARAKRAQRSAPGKDHTPMLVSAVNDKTNAGQTLIGSASCTTNCLATVAKVLHDSFGIRRGLMNTMRAATATQKTADGHSHKDWRGGRGILGNIVPCVANAATAVGVVIPDLNEDKVAGLFVVSSGTAPHPACPAASAQRGSAGTNGFVGRCP